MTCEQALVHVRAATAHPCATADITSAGRTNHRGVRNPAAEPRSGHDGALIDDELAELRSQKKKDQWSEDKIKADSFLGRSRV